MQFSLSGFAFLLGYIVLVGVASFLQKFGMKQMDPYQINLLMAKGAVNSGDGIPILTKRPTPTSSENRDF